MSPSTEKGCTGSVRLVAVEQLRTTYAPLRPGSPRQRHLSAANAAPLPIRVVPTDDGIFEVIDGHKRLAADLFLRGQPLLGQVLG